LCRRNCVRPGHGSIFSHSPPDQIGRKGSLICQRAMAGST
jgi:hypothetical protein